MNDEERTMTNDNDKEVLSMTVTTMLCCCFRSKLPLESVPSNAPPLMYLWSSVLCMVS